MKSPSEFPVTSCGAYHCPSEFPRHAPVGGSSSPKTFDSTACTNLVPAAVQMPLWFARPHRAHLGSLLPEAMLPTQTASLLQTAWLDSSAHPIVWLTHKSRRMTHSLRSTPITRLHRYYEMLRPCTPHRYSRFLRVLQIKLLPSHRDDRFLCSIQSPGITSRRLYAGRHQASHQASAWFVPRYGVNLGFDDEWKKLSTPHRRFACARLVIPHLTHSLRLFLQR